MSDFTVAARLLPDVPGWTAGLASLTCGSSGDRLLRIYKKGRASVFVEVTAGTSAAQVVAQAINTPLGEEKDGRIGLRAWLLRGRRAHLITDRDDVHSLSVVLRGGPGDAAWQRPARSARAGAAAR